MNIENKFFIISENFSNNSPRPLGHRALYEALRVDFVTENQQMQLVQFSV
jgi:hypothetical protein